MQWWFFFNLHSFKLKGVFIKIIRIWFFIIGLHHIIHCFSRFAFRNRAFLKFWNNISFRSRSTLHLKSRFWIFKLKIVLRWIWAYIILLLIRMQLFFTLTIFFQFILRKIWFLKCWQPDRLSFDLMTLFMDPAVCKIIKFLHAISAKTLFLLGLEVRKSYMSAQMGLQIIAVSKIPSLTLIKRAKILFPFLPSFACFFGRLRNVLR